MKKLLLFTTLLASLSGWGQTLNPTTITSHLTYTGNTDNGWFLLDLTSPASTRKVSGATILQSAVKYSDTANMLANYIAAINANLAKEKADSLTLAMAINTNSGAISALQSGKVNVGDTASMLARYLLASIAAATYQPIGAYATTSQLSAYAPLASPVFSGTPKLGTDTLSTKAYARSVAGSGNGGYVPSGASTQYIKGDGTYGALDSSNITGFHTTGFYDGRYGSLAVQNTNSSAITSLQSNKVNYTDSLIKYVTPTQLQGFGYATTTSVNTSLAAKVNYTDSTVKYVTPTQLQGFNYATTSSVNTSLAGKVNYTDSTVKYATPTQLGAKADTAGLAKGTFTNLADKDIIFYNLATLRFINTPLKTVGSNSLFGTGDIPFPTQVNADWNSASGASQILNKPTIPAAQVNSDWNAVSGVAQILNKPSIYSFSGTASQYTKGDGTYGALDSSNITGFHSTGFYDGRYGSLSVQNTNVTNVSTLQNRNINTTYPLQGGGNLTADRTLNLDTTVWHSYNYDITKFQPVGSYQAQLNGTGYAKQSGTTTSYNATIPNGDLTNSSITIAGNSTALGGSVTQDAITGLSATGIIKRTGANTLATATAGTDYVVPSGNITGSAGSVSGTNVVDNTNLTQMAANTLKGNNTGATANAADLTATQVTAMLNPFTTTLKGLVPAPGAISGNLLRDDGTWVAAPGGASTNTANTFTATQTITETTAAASGSLAGNAMVVNQTWNTTGAPTALLINATNTASGSAKLIDLQIGGASKASIDKGGQGTFQGIFFPTGQVLSSGISWGPSTLAGSAVIYTVNGSSGSTPVTTTQCLPTAATTVNSRRIFRSSGAVTGLTAAQDYVGSIFGQEPVTVQASGTTNLFATAAFISPAITSAAGTLTEGTTVFIKDAPTVGTNLYALHVAAGASKFDGTMSYAINAFSAAHTLGLSDHTCLETTGSTGYTVTLPTAVGCKGRVYVIKKVDSGTGAITVGTTSSQNIIGTTTATTYALSTVGKYVTVQSDNAGWQIIGNN